MSLIWLWIATIVLILTIFVAAFSLQFWMVDIDIFKLSNLHWEYLCARVTHIWKRFLWLLYTHRIRSTSCLCLCYLWLLLCRPCGFYVESQVEQTILNLQKRQVPQSWMHDPQKSNSKYWKEGAPISGFSSSVKTCKLSVLCGPASRQHHLPFPIKKMPLWPI